MTRSTVRSFSFGIVTAVLYLSVSAPAGLAHADPGVGPADQVDIIYGGGDEGAIYVGPVTATPHQTTTALAPGDVLFGDADQGAIDAGAAPSVATSQPGDDVSALSQLDLTSSKGDAGAAVVDPSGYAGRSHISAAQLAGG